MTNSLLIKRLFSLFFAVILLMGCVGLEQSAPPPSAVETTQQADNMPALVGTEWHLREMQLADGTLSTPDATAEYTLLLGKDGNVTGQADCNTINSTYTLDESQLTFGPIASTKALCPPGSLSDDYVQALDTVSDYVVMNGTLALTFGTDDAEGGTLIFGADNSANNDETTIPDELIGTWQWQAFEDSASGAESSDITVDDPTLYVLNLLDNGTAQITADCNVAQMEYNVEGNSLTFLPGPMTLAACGPDSLSNEFVMRLGEVVSYVLDGDQLVLNLQADAGNLIFASAADDEPAPASGIGEAVGETQLTPSAQQPPALTVDMLTNLAYELQYTESGTAQMEEVRYEDKANRVVIDWIDTYALGETNGEQAAAAILISNSGGSGSFGDLALVVNQDGVPTHIATAFLGDRLTFNAITIEENEIWLDRPVTGFPVCLNFHCRQIRHIRLVLAGAMRAPIATETDWQASDPILSQLSMHSPVMRASVVATSYDKATAKLALIRMMF